MKKLIAVLAMVGACGGVTDPPAVELQAVECPPDTATTGSITIIVCVDGVCPMMPDSLLSVPEC